MCGRQLLGLALLAVAFLQVEADEDNTAWQVLTRLAEESDQVLDNVCGGSSSISTFSVAQALRNLTNQDVLNILRMQYMQYSWASTGDLDQEYLCGLMQQYNAERVNAEADNKPLELLFYGDAAIQCMRFKSENCMGAIDIFEGWWGEQYRAAVWGIGGETTSALMWRLLAGNIPEPKAKVIVLYTGVMDVQQADQDPDFWSLEMNKTASQIIKIAAYLKNSTDNAQVLLMGLLPITGYDSEGQPSLTMTRQVQTGINSINQQLRDFGLAEPRVSYIDCIDRFLTEEGGNTINEDVYSTNNVPTGKGFKQFAGCINRFVDEYMAKEY